MTAWSAVSGFYATTGPTASPTVDGATQPNDILTAAVYSASSTGTTPPSPDWVRLSGPDQSGAMYGELWQLVITSAMGNAGDMNGEVLTWDQGVNARIATSVMALHTGTANPCRTLDHQVATKTGPASGTLNAPTITTSEESVPLFFCGAGVGSTPTAPAGLAGIAGDNNGTDIGTIATVVAEGIPASTDYSPGAFGMDSTTEAIAYSLAVTDTLAEEPPPDGPDVPPPPPFTTVAPMDPPTDVGIQDGITLTPQAYFSVGVESVGAVFTGLDCTEGMDNYGQLTFLINCKFSGASNSGHVFNRPGGSIILINCEFDCSQTPQAIIGDNVIAWNLDIYGMAADGLKIGSDSWYRHCYIHDAQPGEDAHGDGMQVQDVIAGLTVISDCYVDMVLANQAVDGHYSSAILHDSPNNPAPDGRTPGTLVFVGNYCRGGGYITNIGGDATNVTDLHRTIMHSNVIEAGSYEYVAATPFNVDTTWPDAASLFSYWGNTFDDGTPITTESTLHRQVSQDANQMLATTLAGGTGTEVLGDVPPQLLTALDFIISEYATVSDTSGPYQMDTTTTLDADAVPLTDSIVVDLHARGDVPPVGEFVGVIDQVLVELTRIGEGQITQVTHEVVDPALDPEARKKVAALLRSASGGPFIGAAEITESITRETDAAGNVVLPLIPNAAISPPGSYYEIRVEDGQNWKIVVPVSETPVTLKSCIVPA